MQSKDELLVSRNTARKLIERTKQGSEFVTYQKRVSESADDVAAAATGPSHAAPLGPMDFCASPTPLAAAARRRRPMQPASIRRIQQFEGRHKEEE